MAPWRRRLWIGALALIPCALVVIALQPHDDIPPPQLWRPEELVAAPDLVVRFRPGVRLATEYTSDR